MYQEEKMLSKLKTLKKMVQMNLFAKKEYKDIENKLIDTKQGRRGGINWKTGIDIDTLLLLLLLLSCFSCV